jgi:hypothetical protein
MIVVRPFSYSHAKSTQLAKPCDFTQNPAASGRRLSVVANNTQLVFAQTMQLIQVDAAFSNEVSQD